MAWKHYQPDGTLKTAGDGVPPQGGVCSVYRATNQGPNSGVRKVAFDSRDFDPFVWFDTVNNRFQPKVAGYYDIGASVRTNVSPGAWNIQLYKNGSSIKLLGVYNGSAQAEQFGGVTNVYLNGTSDYVEIFVDTTNSVALIGSSSQMYFWASLTGVSTGVIPEPWNTLAPINNWAVNGGYTVQYMKDPHGFVHMRGSVTNTAGWSWSTASSTPFQLPAGYRPGSTFRAMVPGYDTAAGRVIFRVDVGTDGKGVLVDSYYGTGISGGANGALYELGVITFRAEQ